MSEQIISLPVIGDKIGTIIYEDTVSYFRGKRRI